MDMFKQTITDTLGKSEKTSADKMDTNEHTDSYVKTDVNCNKCSADGNSGSQESTVTSELQRPIKKRRSGLTPLKKREICLHKVTNPKLTQEEMAVYFSCGRTTIREILKDKDKWLAVDPTSPRSLMRQRRPQQEVLEQELFRWFNEVRSKNLTVTGDMVRAQARSLGQILGVPETFAYSNGWMEKFKRRHGIKFDRYAGENGSLTKQSNGISFLGYTSRFLPLTNDHLSLGDYYNYYITGLKKQQHQMKDKTCGDTTDHQTDNVAMQYSVRIKEEVDSDHDDNLHVCFHPVGNTEEDEVNSNTKSDDDTEKPKTFLDTADGLKHNVVINTEISDKMTCLRTECESPKIKTESTGSNENAESANDTVPHVDNLALNFQCIVSLQQATQSCDVFLKFMDQNKGIFTSREIELVRSVRVKCDTESFDHLGK